MTRSRLCRSLALVLLVSVTASCAYYNTFYLAKKYYMKATNGEPYEVDRDGTTQRSNYSKSADYSKKLLGVYPKSKYVDDAWLMWARTLVGTDDPLKAVAMLEEFETRFPKSDLRPDAEFFLGLAYRQAHKYDQAVAAFDEFLAQAPKHSLVPYAFYERSKAFMSLERYREAAESAGQVLERYPRHVIADRALHQRAEARFQQHDWADARADFHTIGDRALTDDDRMRALLREVDCLESSRNFEEARSLLRDARSHVPIPPPLPVMPRVGVGSAAPATPGAPAQNQPQVSMTRTPAEEQYGRLTLRMGDVELLDGHVDRSVEMYRSVLQDYPRSQLSAEAQYRIGYAYETGADDFERARTEYAKVKEQAGMSQFSQQAQSRLDNLDRIDRYRTAAGADSLQRKAEGRFLVAEHYLFSLDRPDRALEEYRAIYDSATTAAVKARALNAEAWLLSRKLDRKTSADSLFWKVVRDYPATEGQLAARDYLEAEGHIVADSLIVAPKDTSRSALDSPTALAQQPGTPQSFTGADAGAAGAGAMGVAGSRTQSGAPQAGGNPGASEQWRSSTLSDSLQRAFAERDSTLRVARSDTSSAGRARADSLERAFAHADTLGRAAMMAAIASEGPHPSGVVVAPVSAKAPNLSAVDTPNGARGASSATHSTHAPAAAGAMTAGATGAAAASTSAAAGGASVVTGAATGAPATGMAAGGAATGPLAGAATSTPGVTGGTTAAPGAATTSALIGPHPAAADSGHAQSPSHPSHRDSLATHAGSLATGAALGGAATGAAAAGSAGAGAVVGSTASGAAAGARLGSPAVDGTRHAATAGVVDTAGHTPPSSLDSTRTAVRSDSLHKSALSPKRVDATPVVAAPVVAAPAVAPVESHSRSMVSWEDEDRGPKLTSAQRDSAHRADKARAVAKRDSLKHVAATRDSLKHAAKAAKASGTTPAPAVPDSSHSQKP